jgi:ribosomal protein S15P/S13E
MFWKSVQSQIKNVTCLEILDDGTLDEYEISSADFPCELSEYVFRSEKRLEDINALFEQAIGKKGIFQTICEVFGEAGRDLSYDEIFHGVTKTRMVARASIDYQLNQRPCFVKLENGRWRFEPDRGAKIGDKRDEEVKEEFPKSHQPVIEKPEEGKDTPTSSTTDITVRSTRSILLSEIRREWALLSELFKNGDEKQHDDLLSAINQLIKFANKWQASLQALVSHDELDSTLVGFWWQVAQDPRNKKTIQLLEKRLQELFDIETIDRVIPQLHQLLASTGNESRQIFHKLLSNVAKDAFEQERFDEALQIYQLLEKSDAGDFQTKIHQIHQQTEVQACLDQLRQEQEFDYRLVILQDTWTKYPNYPSLRRAVHEEVYQSAIGRGSLIQESLEKGDSGKAYQVYEEWSSLIWPLLEGWRQHDITSAAVWEVVRKIFVTLHNQACKSEEFKCFDLALRIANTTPIEIQRHIPAPDYVAVLVEVAQNLEAHEEAHKAAAMMEYGIFLLVQSHRGLERYLEYQVSEYTGRLFEQLELIRRANYYLQRASKFASPEQKKHLGHRRYSLIERIKSSSVGDPDREDRIWKARLESLAGQKEFMVWVDPLVYGSFIEQNKLW